MPRNGNNIIEEAMTDKQKRIRTNSISLLFAAIEVMEMSNGISIGHDFRWCADCGDELISIRFVRKKLV